MKTLALTLIALLTSVIAGCGVNSQKFAVTREALKGSSFRNAEVEKCTRKISRQPVENQRRVGQFVGASIKNTPRTLCRRVANGIASGSLTIEDANSASRGQLTPNSVRVLQGR